MQTDIFVDPSQINLPLLDDEALEFTDYELEQMSAIQKELEAREMSALKLYEPLPFQQAYHSCTAKECIIQKANQVGGTLAGAVEIARAVTGCDPFNKYPKRDGIVALLGYGEKHIGRVFYKYLFRPGAFRIIRDRDTGQWRTFRPWSPDMEMFGNKGDGGREEESQPAPPLIPSRWISGRIAYEKAAEHIFTRVKLTTGWEIYAFNSVGDPGQAQGFQVDLYHIDEDLATPGWHEEAISRTAIRKGKIRWTALPQPKTEDLMNMIFRAEEEEQAGVAPEKRITVRIIATMYDNPYYPEESRIHDERIWKSQGEDIFRKRALGEIVLDSILMYPTFNVRIHEALTDDPRAPKALRILKDRNGEPPEDWCRYMVVDPGHTVAAVLFFATPPPTLGDVRIMYDELYMHNCDKTMFVRNVGQKTQSWCFQDFIIDAHGGALRELGSGILPRRQYEQEMEKAGIKCIARGSRFIAGSDDVKGREERMREWLGINETGYPKLFVVTKKCPAFVKEMARFKKKLVKIAGREVPTDEGVRRVTHAIEACEYGVAHGLPYVKPKHVERKTIIDSIISQRKLRAKARAMKHGVSSVRSLGPRGTPAYV